MTDDSAALKRVFAYHDRTKHHFSRYADGPGQLDWANQPTPFRTWEGCERVPLALIGDELETDYDTVIQRQAPVHPLDHRSMSGFLELSMGISAWKEFAGSRWALRCNPSSGNLHPTECTLILGGVEGIGAGVYHYEALEHVLERRRAVESSAALRESLGPDGFLVGISSIHWRESWKYGERAFRYCQHDIGHAIGSLAVAAGLLGWESLVLDGWGDSAVAEILGLDREEVFEGLHPLDREHPGPMLWVHSRLSSKTAPATEDIVSSLRESGPWIGRPAALSPEYSDWTVIQDVAQATDSPLQVPEFKVQTIPADLQPSAAQEVASTLIRRRRSCQRLDAKTSISRASFARILSSLLPGSGRLPWPVWPWEPSLHLLIFVHRVDDLEPGLYLLERRPEIHAALVEAFRPELLWSPVDTIPDVPGLFLLEKAEFNDEARAVSCGQEIASDGAFSLGMLAEYEGLLQQRGPAWYRRMFWESGLIGQCLYLEAEVAGVRGTGIGCFFDDAVHQIAGISKRSFQSVYHFTVGKPVEDGRLKTLSPYGHLGDRGSGG